MTRKYHFKFFRRGRGLKYHVFCKICCYINMYNNECADHTAASNKAK